MTSTPTPDRIRLTITVTPEVHQVFSRMAEAGGMSLGRCMGDWLTDTLEGAQFVAQKMEEARRAPKVVMREMQAGVLGMGDEVAAIIKAQRAAPSPPSSNTGGKVPRRNPEKGAAKVYSALNPATGERVLLPVGKCFDRSGVVVDAKTL